VSIAAYASACARALTFFSTHREPTVIVLLRRIAWELLYLAPEGTADLAIIMRAPEGPLVVGHAREHMALPIDILKGLVFEHERRESVFLVKDHALDGASFVDAAPRSSVLCRLSVPSGVSPRRECFLWLGLYAVAHARVVEEVQEIAQQLGLWFDQYEGVISAVIGHATRLSSLEEKERELAAILHDVRAPVGGLKYLLTELSSGGIEQSWAATGIRHELAYMENLLATISPAQGENGRFQLEICDADQVVRRVVDRCMVEGCREGLDIVVESSARCVSARIPDVELERVLSNILGNAMRYSSQGKVGLSVRADRSRVVIVVSDTGPGIEPRILKELEDPQSKTVSNASGWGMGLISSKRRIERYGGDLCITSSTERGTTIEVYAPRGPDLRLASSDREDPSVATACVDSVDLVIVDDDEQQVLSMQRVLTRSGLSVRGATSVAEAARLVDSTSARAVLCDATMPDGGALQLMEIFKERGVKSKVAVASGDGSEDLLYRCAAHGAREFFCKPVEIEPLLSWVRSEHVEG